MKKRFTFALFVIVFLAVTIWCTAEEAVNNPVAVSPGSETEIVTVWQSCPTFSWSAVDQAASYKIAVFTSVDGKIAAYENMAAISSPVLSKDIPGPALSWTPSTKESLKTGTIYGWYVQAIDASGNPLGLWSNGKVFKVEQELQFAGIEEKLGNKMREYGVNEETISNVLGDTQSGVKEVIVHGTSTGNISAPEASGIKAFEGSSRTLFGLNAGNSLTTGTQNTFIGYRAGFSTTTGTANSFLGHYAGNTNTTGYYNAFLGYTAGYANTTGYYNTFLGTFAGRFNTIGANNTFLGYAAGYVNTTGYYNTFLGTYAGVANTTGSFNTFLGYSAGYANTTASYNTFLGNSAGYLNTTGTRNSFVGHDTGYNNTTGLDNTFFGYHAGRSNTTASYNLFLGTYAGYNNTTGYYNTYIGRSAGYSNISGGGNVFLGYNAGYFETGSNKLYIANSSTSIPLIYGEFNNNIVKINGSSAKLGVGVYPTYPVHVANGAYCSAGGTWVNASSRALKENIENLSTGEAMAALIKLNPVKYNYKIDKIDKHVGFIAEDVPELVAAADRKGLSPMDITAVLTKVVQELQKENEEYKKIISDLQERVATLEKK